MIPRRIHYCWFGPSEKPAEVRAAIAEWERKLPGYEVTEWNELNFPVYQWRYAKQAYDAGKYAFVSDVARLYALSLHGGIYLDTDVYVKRPLDDLLDNEVVLGFEEFGYIATSTIIAQPGSATISALLEAYSSRQFFHPNGKMDLTTNVDQTTTFLDEIGLQRNGMRQILTFDRESICILPQEAFSPIDYVNWTDRIDSSTYVVHTFGQSWASPGERLRRGARKRLALAIGGETLKRIRLAFVRLRRRICR